MNPTKTTLPLPDPKVFERLGQQRRQRMRTPRLRSTLRYNPIERTTEQKCRDAFATLRPHNLSTQRDFNFIPFESSKSFAEIVLNIKNGQRTNQQEVYTLIVQPLLNKISNDNIHDLQEKLSQKDTSKNERLEWKGKIEFHEAKDYKVFTALSGLMNAQGWKVDENGQQLRPLAGHKELAALDYLNNIRKTFSQS